MPVFIAKARLMPIIDPEPTHPRAADPRPPHPLDRRPGRLLRRMVPWLLAAGMVLMAATLIHRRYVVPIDRTGFTAAIRSMPLVVSGPGTLDATIRATLASRVPGRVLALGAERGEWVEAGHLLIRLDAYDLTGSLAAAEADHAGARQAADQARAARQEAVASATEADRRYRRSRTLSARGAVSPATLDADRTAAESGVAAVAQADAMIRERDAAVVAAAAAVDAVRARLADTAIPAPFDGIVTDRAADLGSLVGAGAPLMDLVDPRSLIVTARIDESRMSGLAPGQPATLIFRSDPDQVWRAAVARVGRAVDAETREVMVDLVAENLPGHWALGQRVDVQILTGERMGVTWVPGAMLAPRPGQPAGDSGVWLLGQDGRARWRRITLGLVSAGRVEVTDGLIPGEVVLAPDDMYPLRRVRLVEDAR